MNGIEMVQQKWDGTLGSYGLVSKKMFTIQNKFILATL